MQNPRFIFLILKGRPEVQALRQSMSLSGAKGTSVYKKGKNP